MLNLSIYLHQLLENLKGTVKVDITPKSSYDKYARELTLENFLKAGYFNPQKLGELKVYAKILPDDAIAPKQDILKAIEIEEEEQRKIAQIKCSSTNNATKSKSIHQW